MKVLRNKPGFALTLFLVVQAALLAWLGLRQSPTIDETGHLAAGVCYWELGRFDLYRVNPPLVRLIAAIPSRLYPPEMHWARFGSVVTERPEWQVGEAFVSANGPEAFWHFTLARWACIPLILLGGYVCYRWAKDLYGELSGLVALILWCFSPNILGHGSLVAQDAAAASTGIAAAFLFWKWLRGADWGGALLAGVALGLAELTKTTWIVLFPLWPLVCVLWRWSEHRRLSLRDWSRQVGQMFTILLLAIFVINCGYTFEGSFQKLKDFQFVSSTLAGIKSDASTPGNRFDGGWLGEVRVPLPKNYVQGIDVQKRDFEGHSRSYIRGSFRREGCWWYYLYALAVKVPLGTWLIALLAIAERIAESLSIDGGGVGRRDGAVVCSEWMLVLLAIVILVFVSANTEINSHMRYVLPMFPFVFIWMSRVVRPPFKGRELFPALAAIGLTGSVLSSIFVYPHCLSYFNELAGGPRGGHAHLINSNIDWGQDLLYLRRWLERHPEARPVHLAYFGNVDPRVAGIEFTLPPPQALGDDVAPHKAKFAPDEDKFGPLPGWYAVSVHFLRGGQRPTFDGQGGREAPRWCQYCYFQHFEPVATAGYSIYIYHITSDEANRVRREICLPELASP